jgi:hypothetical protein
MSFKVGDVTFGQNIKTLFDQDVYTTIYLIEKGDIFYFCYIYYTSYHQISKDYFKRHHTLLTDIFREFK